MEMRNYQGGVRLSTIGLAADITYADGENKGTIVIEISPNWAMKIDEICEILKFIEAQTQWSFRLTGGRFVVTYRGADYYLPFAESKWLLDANRGGVFNWADGETPVEAFTPFSVSISQGGAQ